MGCFRAGGLEKSFGERTIFKEVGLEIRRGDRIGLIGPNGSGKTTLVRCSLGLDRCSGQVSLPPGERVGYVEQEAAFGNQTLWQVLLSSCSHLIAWEKRIKELEARISQAPEEAELSALMREYASVVERFESGGGYQYQNNMRKVASGLGFAETDLSRAASSFSGGQKTRISLAKALVGGPDYLILDEPTNHLDIVMIEWLEQFLSGYPGGVLVVSHDRYFLNQVANRILELSQERLTTYRGNYSDYLKLHAEQSAAREKAYEQQQEYITKTEEYIRKYKAGIKSRQARGRRSQLERLEPVDAPEHAEALSFNFPPPADCADQVAELDQVSAAYGRQVIFEQLSLLIRSGDRLALVGPNGSGKTTLLKLLLGKLKAQRGRVRLGSRVFPGYYSQEHEGLHREYRVIDELTVDCGMTEAQARHYLGAFLFRGDDVYQEVAGLSGGELARLAILKLMLTGANFLVLDEPTNHLDIPTKEAVEEAILQFPGTYLVVSHDRYFLDKIATRVLELDQGRLTEYWGNYTDYRRKKALQEAASTPLRAVKNRPEDAGKRAHSNRERISNERRRKRLEQAISSLERQLAELERRINDPSSYTDPAAGATLAEDYERVKEQLELSYEEWLEATEAE